MAPLRCLIDSMVFDAIAAEPDALVLVDRLTTRRRLELLAAAETMRELAAVPDPARRRRLQRVRVLVVAPAGPSPVLDALRAAPGVSEEDAAIAAAAAEQGVPLVTEDRDLRLAAASTVPDLPLWRWHSDLLPRLVALAAE